MENFLKVFLLCVLPLLSASEDLENAKLTPSSVTTPSLVKGSGYPLEEHVVKTSDGYILTMHRIPSSPKVGKPSKRAPVAFLMHGLLCSSSDWVILGPNNALAYTLSDAGYDVWMGNARGNTYSRNHTTKNPDRKNFWNFSWHEIAVYDLPAMIKYALNNTGEEKVLYFGHSQGTTTFLVLNSMQPEFGKYIESAHLFAPVGYMSNMKSPIAKVGGPLIGESKAFQKLFGTREFLPNSKAMEKLGSVACKDEAVTQVICSNVLLLIGGYNSPYLNTTMIPEIMSVTPAGASIRQALHYLQEYNSGYFRQYDFGSSKNKRLYGQENPPRYNVEKINASLYLYHGDNDYFSDVADVKRLAKELQPHVLKLTYMMPTMWNHLDFLYGLNVKEHLYDVALHHIRQQNSTFK